MDGYWVLDSESGGADGRHSPPVEFPPSPPPSSLVETALLPQAWDNAHAYTFSRLTDAGVMPLIQTVAGNFGTTSDQLVALLLGVAMFLKGMGETIRIALRSVRHTWRCRRE